MFGSGLWLQKLTASSEDLGFPIPGSVGSTSSLVPSDFKA